MANSFRIAPNMLKGGDAAEILVEGILEPSLVRGKDLTVDVSVKDQLAARFVAVVQRSESGFRFSSAERVDALPAELPGPTPLRYQSPAGKPLKHQPFTNNPTYAVPHIKLAFQGTGEPPVIIRLAPAKHSHPYQYEVTLKVMLRDRILFDGTKQPTYVDCSDMIASNCYQVANCLLLNHHEQIDRTGIGTSYGSQYDASPDEIASLHARGLGDRSCVGYLLSTLSAGHDGFGAEHLWQDARSYYEQAHRTRTWGSVAKRTGVGLTKGLVEKALWSSVAVCLDPTDQQTQQQLRKLVDSNQYYDMHPENIITNHLPNMAQLLDALNNLTFAIINIRNGLHTGVLHRGRVLEVHWDRGPSQKALFDNKARVDRWFPFGRSHGPQLLWISIPPGLWIRAKRARGLR